MENKNLSVRELMQVRGFDPAEEMIDLIVSLKKDKLNTQGTIDKTIELLDPELMNMAMGTGVDIDKLRLATLKALSDAKQREDEQRLKLEDQKIKREALQGKGRSNHSGAIIEYKFPNYKKLTDKTGKIELVIDGSN